MREFNKIKSVAAAISLLIFVLMLQIVYQDSRSENEFEKISQNIVNAQVDKTIDNYATKTKEMKNWGFSFTEFDPSSGTIQNTVYKDRTVYTSIDLIDSENILLGQKN